MHAFVKTKLLIPQLITDVSSFKLLITEILHENCMVIEQGKNKKILQGFTFLLSRMLFLQDIYRIIAT